MSLKLRIRQLRLERNLTQTELAQMIGVSTAHISEVERGKKNLNNHIVLRLSKAFDVEPFMLFEMAPLTEEMLANFSRLSESDQRRVAVFASNLSVSYLKIKDQEQ